MPLESLLELVETLRKRIDEHGAALRQNEMRTRYSLIDPLLSGLGWNISDPSEVVIEDGSGEGRADYALQVDGRPSMIIEAKRLGLGVSDGRRQAINYAMDPERAARYFGVTDGNQWEIYDTHQPAINMLVVSFTLRGDTVAAACLKALALWKHSVAEDTVVVGEAPILGLKLEPQEIIPPDAGPRSQPANITQSPTATSDMPSVRYSGTASIDDKVWIPLSEYRPASREKPIEIMFPDSTTCPVKYMREVLIETTRWLVRTNNLDPYNQNHCPITGTSRNIISNYPTHPDGESFENPEQVEGLWVNTKYPNPQTVRNTCKVIIQVGLDPSHFKVRLPS
ncbi:MAG: type I restriction endonuclease [Chloroflexi bacterium]|nr:type I restriction endonuclease [Chloroflexota bacterium]